MSSNCLIITGSKGGIGSHLVREYCDAGYMVIGIDYSGEESIDQEGIHQISYDLNKIVTDKHLRSLLFDRLESILEITDPKITLINNAAIQIIKPINELQIKDMTNSFNINTIAPTIIFQMLLPRLISSSGSVLNISSVHSKVTKENFSIYAASKAALESMTKSWAIEFSKENISINALSPAAIDTPLLREGFLGDSESLLRLSEYHPAGKIGDPSKLASLARKITELNDSFFSGSVIDYSGAISSRLHDPK